MGILTFYSLKANKTKTKIFFYEVPWNVYHKTEENGNWEAQNFTYEKLDNRSWKI